jgi:DNA-directed RNA polymerase specialized sigma24 family protein
MKTASSTINYHISTDIPQVQVPSRKWVLTQEAFDRLLASLGEDRESAGMRYLEIRSNLVRFFEWRGSPFPQDHADETINRIARKISESEQIRNPDSYYLGVARMLLLEFNRERVRHEKALNELTRSIVTSGQSDDSDARIDCLRGCLEHLSPENRELILKYYNGEKGAKIDSRKKLAERFGLQINTLRMRALRIREGLQKCVENCQKQCGSNCANSALAALVSGKVVNKSDNPSNSPAF